MIAVIFEVEPASDGRQAYLDLASDLRPLLETFDGFLTIERFESLSSRGKILSLSFWRDEEAVHRWRNLERHREAQRAGRNGLFNGYRLRIASVLRDYGMTDRAQAPSDSAAFHSV
jgi:heme-degrading monooxygenase HmoA